MTPARKEPDGSTYSGRFAIRLKQLREKAKLTAPEFAEKVGVKSVQTIYDWESTKSQPKISQLPILAEVLGINIRTILPDK